MRINSLSFKFDNRKSEYFFKDISLDFYSNTLNFIQGDNGIGKSTLFKILQGVCENNVCLEGSFKLEGTLFKACNNKLPKEYIQKVHTVQQNYDIMIANQFTFIENLQMANLPKYPNLNSLPKVRLFDFLKSLDIDLNKPAYLYSGGQRQLLAILMALQKPTKLLLLDEPTATLDKKNAQMVIESLYSLANQLQVTMLIICHDKELLKKYGKKRVFTLQLNNNGERFFS